MVRRWLQEWWPLGLGFAAIGCFLHVMTLHNRTVENAWATWAMALGYWFILIVWWREFKAMRARHKRIWEEMEERHRREWVAFHEKWGEFTRNNE